MNTADEIIVEATTASTVPNVRRCEACGTPTMPSLFCKDCGGVLRLRWFVRRAADLYVAECVDLDITAEGASVDAAIAGLQDAMCGYLLVAAEGEMEGLVPRPSPLSHRLLYHYESFKDRISTALSRPRANAKEVFIHHHSHCPTT